MLNRILTGMTVSLLSGTFAFSAHATQLTVPSPLTVVVPYPPGGASDRAARIVSEGLQQHFDTNVIVEKRSGAGGRIAAPHVKSTGAADSTVVLANPAIMVVAPMVYAALAYDPQEDFQPIAMATQ